MPGPPPAALDWVPAAGVLAAGALALLTGAVGYRTGHPEGARRATLLGFGALGVLFSTAAVAYASSSRSDRAFLVVVSLAALALSVRAGRLVAARWPRSDQLATTVATTTLVVLPFELVPSAQVALQERWAAAVAAVAGLLGARPVVEPAAGGALIRLAFANGGHMTVTWECTGLQGVAVFGGILVAARTTLARKLAGIGVMLSAVFAVQLLRMVLVALAIAGDWFGPLLTDADTVQTSYYVAELGVGQPLVVVSTVVGVRWVGRWIPDLVAFLGAFVRRSGQSTPD